MYVAANEESEQVIVTFSCRIYACLYAGRNLLRSSICSRLGKEISDFLPPLLSLSLRRMWRLTRAHRPSPLAQHCT